MIAAAILTSDRVPDLEKCLSALRLQTQALDHICIVDAGKEPVPDEKLHGVVKHIRSVANLGGAGGFSYAILSALATGAEWIWIMDDDACPLGDDCLQTLLAEAKQRNLFVVSPIIVSPDDYSRLSFPFRIKGELTYDRKTVETVDFIPDMAQFFNGALMHRDVFYKIGLPDMRLFIRGDEVDFLIRLHRAKIPMGTVTNAAMSHPVGWGEVVPIVKGKMAILMPETPFKRYYFYRNRGYLARRHRRVVSFFADSILYPYAFLILRKGDFSGLKEWARAFWHGLTYDFRSVHDEPFKR